jgi:hypothetical protein
MKGKEAIAWKEGFSTNSYSLRENKFKERSYGWLFESMMFCLC